MVLLSKSTVLLTGATGGIGSELARSLSHEWADLILVAHNKSKLLALAKEIGGSPTCIVADLSAKKGRIKVAKALTKKKIDILINCAGVGIYKLSDKLTEADWYTSYELNVHTPFFLTRDLKPGLTVNIGSCSAVQYKPERALYNSTKAALRSLSLCLAKEKRESIVHITLDSTLTDFGPLSIAEKKVRQLDGMDYLSPVWVATKITSIIKMDARESEYVLSPHCYEGCGVWEKP